MSRKESQKKQILEYLKTHAGITAIDALNLCGCFRLAAVICRLRKEGWDISTEIYGEGQKRYAFYVLINEQ